jgi:hypothetical protein
MVVDLDNPKRHSFRSFFNHYPLILRIPNADSDEFNDFFDFTTTIRLDDTGRNYSIEPVLDTDILPSCLISTTNAETRSIPQHTPSMNLILNGRYRLDSAMSVRKRLPHNTIRSARPRYLRYLRRRGHWMLQRKMACFYDKGKQGDWWMAHGAAR